MLCHSCWKVADDLRVGVRGATPSPINLASKHLTSFLADSPLAATLANNSESVTPQSTATPQAATTIAQDDNDFSMEF